MPTFEEEQQKFQEDITIIETAELGSEMKKAIKDALEINNRILADTITKYYDLKSRVEALEAKMESEGG